VKFLRTTSTVRLVALVVAVVAVAAAGAAIAVAARSSGPTPPAKPLDRAIHDALAAPEPAGITARITFTNNLFPSGSLLGNVGSALMSGASGRLWVTNDGRGRLELQSDAGDAQIGWDKSALTVYDASSNTVYRATLPAPAASSSPSAPPALSEIDSFLQMLGAHASISDAQPTNVAGQQAYGVSVAPLHDGGLLGSAELAWDALRGVPLSLAIYAQGHGAPALALRATDISYGPVSATDVAVTPPAGAKVVDLGGAGTAGHADKSSTPAVTGLANVQAAAGFPVVAPDTLVGLPQRDVRLVGGDTVLVAYGQGLGGLLVVERKADASASGNGLSGSLPTLSLDGVTAHELATELGTVISWQQGGTDFVLAGSLPPAAAEAAARALK
jgi:hypothetical protein